MLNKLSGSDSDFELYSKQVKEHVMESITMFAKTRVYRPIAGSLGIDVSESPDFKGVGVALYCKLMKSLVKSEVEVEESDLEKIEECPGDHIYIPARPVDHLLEFLSLVCPVRSLSSWIESKKQETCIVVKDVYNVKEKHIHRNHYHLMPWDPSFGDRQTQYRFMSWGGDYYEGSPMEWGHLKDLRRAIESADRMMGPYDYEKKWFDIHALMHKQECERRSIEGS